MPNSIIALQCAACILLSTTSLEAKMASPRRSKRVKRAAQRSSSSNSTDDSERVYAALSSGALAFLALQDAVVALATCRLLRNDAALVVAALSHTDVGCHFRRRCAVDWMSVPSPSASKQLHEALFYGDCSSTSSTSSSTNASAHDSSASSSQCNATTAVRESLTTRAHIDASESACPAQTARQLRAHSSEHRGMNHALLGDPRVGSDGPFAAHLLSLVGMMQTHVLPLCYDFTRLNKFGDTCAARPVLLSLTRADTDAGAGAGVDADTTESNGAPTPWTRDDVRRALNAEWNLLGDEFTSSSAAFVHVSDVGAHWENIAVGKRRGKPSCGLCDTARKCVREYKREASAMLKQFNEVLSAKKSEWRREGFDAEEIHQKRSELKAQFFPEDSYPDVHFADSHDDDVLADICESDRFPLDPFAGMAAGFDRANDDIFNALSEQYMHLCASLYRPLKRVLAEHLAFVGQRVHRSWMNDDDGTITSELVAGVSPYGVLCGVFIAVKRAEYELPHSIALDGDNDNDNDSL